MGSGGGDQTQTTSTQIPEQLGYWADKYIKALGNAVLPGGNLAPSPLPNQEVAPLTPQQLQGMNLVSSETYGPGGSPAAQGAGVNTGALMQGVMGPNYWNQAQTNPWIKQAFSMPALNQLSQLYLGG